jgi:hypothetical protein
MSPSTHRTSRASRSPRVDRRRTAAALLAAALVVVPMTFGPGPAAALPPSCGLAGDGTELSPYEVANGTHLALVGVDGCELDAYYLQTASFTLTGAHTPIGTSGEPFEGVYDGGGNTITGLTIDGSAASLGLVGLFGAADGAEFKDLTLAGVDVSGPAGDGCVGTLVGGVGGASIENVHVSGEATGAVLDFADTVGGLVGCAFGSEIADSSADVEVVGLGDYVGGLIGYAYDTVVRRSWASGDVTGVGSVGGLIGYAESDSGNPSGTVVEGSWASGDVQASGSSAGGLIGYSEATITDSYATGDVVGTGSDSYGGLVGGHASPAGPIRRSYATGNVSGTSYVGGLVGYTFNADLEDVYAHGDVTATRYVGGLVGQVTCEPSVLAVGGTVTCTVTGGDPGIDILWRAAYNPVIASPRVAMRRSAGMTA